MHMLVCMCVCVRAQLCEGLYKTVWMFLPMRMSHPAVFRPSASDCGSICWKCLFITFFCLSPRSALRPPRVIFPRRPCACPGMCLKAWATSGHSLSTSATCLTTQRTSAWSAKRRASRRFLSKVCESLSLEESSFQQREFFFSARFSEHCHLSVERADSSVPSSCLCLSSVYLNAFVPDSSVLLSVVCSLIFNGYRASFYALFLVMYLCCGAVWIVVLSYS